MDSFLAFSRKCISASAGVIPLVGRHSSDVNRVNEYKRVQQRPQREYAKTTEIIHRFIASRAFWKMVAFMAAFN